MKTLKKSFLILLPAICSLFWLSGAQAQPYGENIFIIHDAVGKPDSTVVIYLEVVNDDMFLAFHVDIPLPEGFDFVEGSAILNPARNDNNLIFGHFLDGTNILRIISFALGGWPYYEGNDGIVATFELYTTIQAGNYQLLPDTAVLGNIQGHNIVSGVVDGTVYITPEGPVPGDANCDGLVNVNDVITTIHYVLGNIPKPFCFANTDLDDDLEVDVTDVVGIIHIVLQLE
jgi:hypothetical protein